MSEHPGVQLIGSVAMADAESVFKTLAGELGPWLKRLPDGETGPRKYWILWQRTMLREHPAMEIDPTVPPLQFVQWDGKLVREIPGLRFKPGIAPESVMFETGYAPAAIESYATFRRLRDAGVIPKHVRFQVSLPTPMGPGFLYISPKAFADFLPPYERAIVRALDAITAEMPRDELAIQWDVCQEVLAFENYFQAQPADAKEQVFAELARLGNRVPKGVELGYHLCYGSPQDEHLLQPKDMGVMVEIANGFIPRLARPLDFLHLPVPKSRSDAAYFAPLKQLKLPSDTTLYLGLIHHADPAGDQARIAAAKTAAARFGIASECGWGRGDPSRVAGMIAAHRDAAQTLAF
ncbi:MAG TPA: hypothetical protein VGU20_04100 [Stellaceae bacterium]|nr:hypothetical protein [Stellaceae bacterium]